MFIRGLGVLLLALTLWEGLPAQTQDHNADKGTVRIGALYMKIDAPMRLLEGVQEALKDNKLENVVLVDLGYTEIGDGLSKLRNAVENETVDIIIGPTESDIFVRALDEREKIEQNKIPLISPLITADVDVQESEWFFRTNVGVNRRAQVMYDCLRKYWIRSMAVLHANTEFGRRAEAAFKAEFLNEFDNTDQYLSESYDPPPDIRDEYMAILNIPNLFYPDWRIADFAELSSINRLILALILYEKAKHDGTYFHGFENSRLGSGHWNENGHAIAGEQIAERICSDTRPGQRSR